MLGMVLSRMWLLSPSSPQGTSVQVIGRKDETKSRIGCSASTRSQSGGRLIAGVSQSTNLILKYKI